MKAYCTLFKEEEREFPNLVEKKGYNKLACDEIDKLQHKQITKHMKYYGIEFKEEQVHAVPVMWLRSRLKLHLKLLDSFGNVSARNVVEKEKKAIKRMTKYIKVDTNIVSPSPSRRELKRGLSATPRHKKVKKRSNLLRINWVKGRRNKDKCLTI